MWSSRKTMTAYLLCALAWQSGKCFARQATSHAQPDAPRSDADLDRIDKRALLERLNQLEKRLSAVESQLATQNAVDSVIQNATRSLKPVAFSSQSTDGAVQASAATPALQSSPTPAPQTTAAEAAHIADLLHGTTINLYFDGYYGYNFNEPIGRVNRLRAYDVSSNAFSLSQADLILENAPDPANGKRFGVRFDLQYGQATQTVQGNPANEPRPDIYRNIFQAYGTYVIPIGNGLTVDFGKFASSLGLEGNYAKDQMNYSRSFWFSYLPFYHEGIRANYKFNDKFALNYWMVNGTQQTEPFNGFKDEFFGLNIQPKKTINWNVNYYLGQENPDVMYFPNGGAPPDSPTEQGVPFQPIHPSPQGKLHIFDSYVSWQATPKLSLALEGDYVIQRLQTYSPPLHVDGGAVYARYQIAPKIAIAGRAEYLSDRGGLFSGTTQALKETTFTTEYVFADGFLVRGEWRRDASNQPYFYTNLLGVLKKEQNTATLGVIWWFGGKQGTW
jgi:Putative beta-barrel porin-2, OmpL-like. bbp2